MIDAALELPRAAWSFSKRQLSMPLRPLMLLLVILSIALTLRLHGIQRHPMHKFESLYIDEQKIINNTLIVMRGRHPMAHYPWALYRWLVPQFRVAKAVTFWVEDVPEGRWLNRDADFVAHVNANPLPYYVLARANMTFFSMALILLLFMIARQLAGLVPALGVAALAAVTPLFVIYSKMAYYDLPMAFWFAVTLTVLAWTWQRRSISGVYWSTALLVWTACCKQNALVLAPIGLVVVAKVAAEHGGYAWWAAWRSRHLWLAGLLALLLLWWGYPAVVDREALATFLKLLRTRYYNVSTDTRAPNWLLWVGAFWPRNAHISVLLLMATGLVPLVWLARHRTLALFFVIGTGFYILVAGGSKHSIDRTMLPALPGLLLGVAGWGLVIRRYLQRPALKWLALALLVGPALVSLLFNSVRYNLLITCKETRALAADWLAENAPAGSRIGVENYGPFLPKASKNHYLLEASTPDGKKRKPAFINLFYGRLNGNSAEKYRRRHVDFLVFSLAFSEPGRGQKDPRWTPNRKYRKILAAFPEVVRFEPHLPPEAMISKMKGAFQDGDWGTFFDRSLIDFWRNHDSFVLGPPILIHRVE